MQIASSAFSRDANRIAITENGLLVQKAVTFTGSGATVATPIFKVTGSVHVLALYGICTTVFGATHTDAHWRINDQTATDVVLSKTTTLDISGISVGAMIVKDVLAATKATYKSSDVGSVLEPAVVQTQVFSPFLVVQKTGGIETDIEYVYTTADTPTSGAMTFYCGFVPLSANGTITSL